jgi:hypothetical protein
MEPVTTVTTAWTIAKTAGEISKKVFELGKGLKDRAIRQQIDEIVDRLHELKKSASELEDQNQELKEKLRFKSNEFEFRHPFYYERAHSEQALCPKCFASNKASPMGDHGQGCTADSRSCLVCGKQVQVYYSSDLPF